MINIKEEASLNQLNHSCAHVLAQAVKHLYPDAKFWVGPVITEGFYYDIDLGEKVLKEEDLPLIEKEMKSICKDGKRITKEELSKEQALAMFSDDEYKIDLLSNMDEKETLISCYRQGDFVDLCRGPHQDTVKDCRNFRLLKVSGAYWKGIPENKVLQRVYGICFFTAEQLQEHLELLEEAKKRDHKKLGRELELFMFSEYGPGFPFWLPNGMILRRKLEDFWYKRHEKAGYQFVQSPIMLNQQLWEVSGHWDNYGDNMYLSKIDDRAFAIKPMNCPGGILIYKNTLHSYRELPIRLGELGLVHRHEASGALNGLFRVRNFTQDDAHSFLTFKQIEEEVINLINFIDEFYKVFGLTYKIELSTRPEKFIGEIEDWDLSEAALAKACKQANQDFVINEGDGAFYGPKLDFHIQDSLGRVWQCGTIQLDMNLPERFDLEYIAADGSRKRPTMIHRVVFGSIERFIGILIEHYGGIFPLWLAPNQITIIPVLPEKHLAYAEKLQKLLQDNDYRSSIDSRNEKLGYRMRDAQTKKVPIQLVVGDTEVEKNEVNLRYHGSQDSENLTIDKLLKLLVEKASING